MKSERRSFLYLVGKDARWMCVWCRRLTKSFFVWLEYKHPPPFPEIRVSKPNYFYFFICLSLFSFLFFSFLSFLLAIQKSSTSNTPFTSRESVLEKTTTPLLLLRLLLLACCYLASAATAISVQLTTTHSFVLPTLTFQQKTIKMVKITAVSMVALAGSAAAFAPAQKV